MAVSVLVVAILALSIGLAFCFAGYRFFRLLIALWGFLAGFLLTTQALATSAGSRVLVSTAGVIIAVIVGLIVAALPYWLYVAAVVILSVSVGFWIGSGLMTAIGYGSHSTPTLLTGILVAVILALLTLALNLTKWLIILSTALGGASTIIAAVLLFLRVIPVDNLSSGLVGAIFRGSPLWGLVWLVLTGAGILVQVRSTQRYAQDYAHAQSNNILGEQSDRRKEHLQHHRVEGSTRRARMPISYTNRKCQTYTLYRGQIKADKPRYYFGRTGQGPGEPVTELPPGFTISESVNGIEALQ